MLPFRQECLQAGSAWKYWGCGSSRPGFRTWLGGRESLRQFSETL